MNELSDLEKKQEEVRREFLDWLVRVNGFTNQEINELSERKLQTLQDQWAQTISGRLCRIYEEVMSSQEGRPGGSGRQEERPEGGQGNRRQSVLQRGLDWLVETAGSAGMGKGGLVAAGVLTIIVISLVVISAAYLTLKARDAVSVVPLPTRVMAIGKATDFPTVIVPTSVFTPPVTPGVSGTPKPTKTPKPTVSIWQRLAEVKDQAVGGTEVIHRGQWPFIICGMFIFLLAIGEPVSRMVKVALSKREGQEGSGGEQRRLDTVMMASSLGQLSDALAPFLAMIVMRVPVEWWSDWFVLKIGNPVAISLILVLALVWSGGYDGSPFTTWAATAVGFFLWTGDIGAFSFWIDNVDLTGNLSAADMWVAVSAKVATEAVPFAILALILVIVGMVEVVRKGRWANFIFVALYPAVLWAATFLGAEPALASVATVFVFVVHLIVSLVRPKWFDKDSGRRMLSESVFNTGILGSFLASWSWSLAGMALK